MLKLDQVALPPRLFPFSAEVGKGEQIHLLGPNGAGKSTLLAAIAGLEQTGGEIRLESQSLTVIERRFLARRRAYLCQLQLPAITMPLFQYLALHQPESTSRQALDNTIELLVEKLGLHHKLAHTLGRLSGGEWQRARLVAVLLQIWPAINRESRLLLLDEPMNGLDIAQRATLARLLQQLCSKGMTIITSSHDLNHTLHRADRVWLMKQGKVIADGAPQQVMQPELLYHLYGIEFDMIQLTEQRSLMMVREENQCD